MRQVIGCTSTGFTGFDGLGRYKLMTGYEIRKRNGGKQMKVGERRPSVVRKPPGGLYAPNPSNQVCGWPEYHSKLDWANSWQPINFSKRLTP